ncbi:hypothetical protein BVI1335_1040002 [Burkholderia vietnamiensis]|nr:hypothetical protein BVI1335_1040002 [Burkholderia vietnamiensis]
MHSASARVSDARSIALPESKTGADVRSERRRRPRQRCVSPRHAVPALARDESASQRQHR